MRDSIVFYRSFYEAIKELQPEIQAKVYTAIFEYSLNFNEIKLDGLAKTIFRLIKPQLDANIKKYNNGRLPKQKQTISKTEAKDKQNVSKLQAKDKQTISKTEANVNDNVNLNDNVNVNQECKSESINDNSNLNLNNNIIKQKNPVGYLETQENPKKPKKADSDSKSDSDSKNDNTSLKKKQKTKFVFGDEHKNYLSWFNKITGKGIKSFNQTDVNNFEQLKELKYTGKDHNDAVKMLMVNEWAKENGAVSPSHFLRKDNFERYLQQSQAGGKEVCPYNEEQLKLANKYLESGGTPDWFDKKWIYKLPSYGTKHY